MSKFPEMDTDGFLDRVRETFPDFWAEVVPAIPRAAITNGVCLRCGTAIAEPRYEPGHLDWHLRLSVGVHLNAWVTKGYLTANEELKVLLAQVIGELKRLGADDGDDDEFDREVVTGS